MSSVINSGDTAWVLISSALVLLMTPGLAFFYAGMTRSKNVVSTLFQNFSALGVVGIIWSFIGYTFSFGPTTNGWIGGLDYIFLNSVGTTPNSQYAATIPHSAFMIFQCMFAVITPALITGAIAERVKFKSFLIFMALWVVVVYAPVAHWVWGVGGFIRQLGGLDFAGGMVVHMTSGFSALMVVKLIGPRRDFEGKHHRPYDVGMVLLGTALLWFGWFGFNAGSALGANEVAAQAFATTFFASAASFVTWIIVDHFRGNKTSAVGACVGAIAGLVTVTPAAGFITLNASIICGIISGITCNYAVSYIKVKFHFDDTLDVLGCHGVGGLLGTILTAFFATKSVNQSGADGVFYGSYTLLKAHLIGAISVAAISGFGSFILFKLVDYIFGFRVSDVDEIRGLDISQHGEVINTAMLFNDDDENDNPEIEKKIKSKKKVLRSIPDNYI